jgi:hypothetical protein
VAVTYWRSLNGVKIGLLRRFLEEPLRRGFEMVNGVWHPPQCNPEEPDGKAEHQAAHEREVLEQMAERRVEEERYRARM